MGVHVVSVHVRRVRGEQGPAERAPGPKPLRVRPRARRLRPLVLQGTGALSPLCRASRVVGMRTLC